jgi:outer membrane protein
MMGTVSILLPSPSAYGADSAPAPKIGVVNLERIFEQYEKTRSFKARIRELSQTKQQERERIVSGIKELREEMVLLNEEGRRERQGSYEEKMKGLAAFDRQAKESLRKEEEGALKVIQDEIEQAVNSFAKEQGFTLILVDRAVLYGVEAMDVTEEVLALLNERRKEDKR